MLDAAEITDPAVRREVIAARDIPAGLGDMDNSLLLLFKAIREKSTVALSGESADEVFGGYRWFLDPTAQQAETFPWMAFAGTQMQSRTAMLNPELGKKLDFDSYIADEYRSALAAVPKVDGESASERKMREVCHLHLTRFVRMLLDRKDRTSMATGLEVRVPFCDHRLVEYVYNTPWSFKTFDGREQSLLRATTKHVLPQSVVDRTKSPYPSTQDTKYAKALQKQLADVISEDSAVFDIVDRKAVRAMCATEPGAVTGELRKQMDRTLDLYHWLDMYAPTLEIA